VTATTKRLSQAEVKRRLIQAFETTLSSGSGLSEREARHLFEGMFDTRGEAIDLDDERELAQRLRAIVRLTLGTIVRFEIRKALAHIKTEAELSKAIEEVRKMSEGLPSLMRKALKAYSQMLPRAGGPGRRPKLSEAEASRACDHIAIFIRQKMTLKQALQKMADSSPSLLGKKVSPRTLQKAWNQRDTLAST
jgi:hypothetical protein